MTTAGEKFAAFRDLHAQEGTFLIPNAWDAGSARILTAIGYQAVATTSAGLAFSIGRKDSRASLSRETVLKNARSIAEATDLPVSADLEDGFGASPEECAFTIELASEAGLVGGSIEDATGNPASPIFDHYLAVERIAAASEAARRNGIILTARAENFLWGYCDLDDTINRLQAFERAGADVLYAPGLPSLEAVKAVCSSVTRPVNVVAGLKAQTFTVAELQAAGVKRISVGGSFARAALGALKRAAQEVIENGTFDYSSEALSADEAASYMLDAER